MCAVPELCVYPAERSNTNNPTTSIRGLKPGKKEGRKAFALSLSLPFGAKPYQVIGGNPSPCITAVDTCSPFSAHIHVCVYDARARTGGQQQHLTNWTPGGGNNNNNGYTPPPLEAVYGHWPSPGGFICTHAQREKGGCGAYCACVLDAFPPPPPSVLLLLVWPPPLRCCAFLVSCIHTLPFLFLSLSLLSPDTQCWHLLLSWSERTEGALLTSRSSVSGLGRKGDVCT